MSFMGPIGENGETNNSAFHFDALSQFILFRQLSLQRAGGFDEIYNAEKRTM